MKTWIAMLLCAALLTGLAGCRRDRTESAAQEQSIEEAPPAQDLQEEVAPIEPEAPAAPQEDASTAASGMSERLRRAFLEAVADEPGSDMRELAEEIADECDLPFEVSVTEAANGPLAGFGDAAIDGFSEGAMFAPNVSTIPFIGYVFRTEHEDAAKALLGTLSQHADLRWNVCTEAETVVSEQVGNIAFFAMTAESLTQ